jgi:N-acetylglucosamine malate deacetylase 1
MDKVLVIVSHPDDEVLGCGATIAKHTQNGDTVKTVFLADGFSSRESSSNRDASAYKASEILGCETPLFLNFPDNQLDTVPLLTIVKEIENIIDDFKPSTVYTHHSGDLNIDHSITHKAVVTACRPQPNCPVHCLLSFEVPSSTEWQAPGLNIAFQPNWFEDVNDTFDLKVKALKIYESEMREWPHARSLKSIEHLARWRGASVGCEAVEAFVVLRLIKQ